MFQRCWFTTMLAIGASCLFAASATAGSYSNATLGKVLPMWTEVQAAVNADGDAVWTAWDGQLMTQAKFYNSASNTVLAAPKGNSKALGISPRADSHTVFVVGSTSSTQRLLDREAYLWRIDPTNGNVDAAISLGANTRKNGGTGLPPVQQSAAYGIIPEPGKQNRYYIVGATRDRVANAILPQPAIWTVKTSNGFSSQDYALLGTPNGNNSYGQVIDITYNSRKNKTWACGQTGSLGGYLQATCWDLSGGISNVTADLTITQRLTAKFGQPPVSSIVNRVRTIPSGPNGKLETVVVGMAMLGDPNNANTYRWAGWAWNITRDTVWSDFSLASISGIETMVYDVAAVHYAQTPNNADTSWGMEVGGTSTTAGAYPDDIFEAGQEVIDVDAGNTRVLRAITTRVFSDGALANTDLTCKAQREMAGGVGTRYDQIAAMSPNGDYRLAQSNGKLHYLTTTPGSTDVHINVIDTDIRHKETQKSRTRTSGHIQNPRTTYQLYEATSTESTKKHLRVGSGLSCDDTESANCLGSPQGGDPVNAYDISETKTVDISSKTSGVQAGTFPHDETYAQLANDCSTISPVMLLKNILHFNGEADGWSANGHTWTHCADSMDANYATDTDIDYDNCGTCGNGGVNSLSACSIGYCEDGTLKAEGRPTAQQAASTKRCWIHNNDALNNGTCVSGGAYDEVPVNYNANLYQKNYCQRCEPSAAIDGWTHHNAPDDTYRCIAHHNSSIYGCESPGGWCFFSRSNKGSTTYNGQAVDFKLDDYDGNHLCTRSKYGNNDANTRATTNSLFWSHSTSTNTPQWPGNFHQMTSESHNSDQFTNTIETRLWLFQKNMTYLGQMNAHKDEGAAWYMGWKPTTFYLEPGEEKWLYFYYNDEQDWQDRIGTLVQFDATKMDLEVKSSFICGYHGQNGWPRMDGFGYCGAEGIGSGSRGGNRAAYGVSCEKSYDHQWIGGNNQEIRYTSCVSSTPKSYGDLPWVPPANNMENEYATDVSTGLVSGLVPKGWGTHQGGIYVEGHIDCLTKPYKNASDRDGWAIIRVKRKNTAGKNDPNLCTPITLRATYFHHNTKYDHHKCW